MKKFTPLVLLALAVPSIASAAFPDVFSTNPYKNAVQYVYDNGIVSGYPNGNFGPEMIINRAEFVKILTKTQYSESEISSCKNTGFSDVQGDAWFAPYVCFAKLKGIIGGYEDNTFRPDQAINFSEAAKILNNTLLAEEKIVPTRSYTEWYGKAVDALGQKSAIPVSIGGFDSEVTRGEMAEMIYRLKENFGMVSSLSFDEMNDRKLIEEYYGSLASGQFQKAYYMKVDPGMSLESFQNLYKDFPYSKQFDYKKIATHTYEFTVMTFPNIDFTAHEKSERFLVQMKVVDGKLQTLSSIAVTNDVLEELPNGTVLKWMDGNFVLASSRDDDATVYKKFSTAEDISTTIKNLSQSADGRYVTYQVFGWEFVGVGLIDTQTNTALKDLYSGNQVYGFTANNEHFYFCSESGMGSGELFVMNLPGFTKNVLESEKMISSCGPFDASTNTLHYELTDNATGVVAKESYVIQ